MNSHRPLLIGITGGIGAGKSTAAKIFSVLGIPVYSADDRAKWLMVHSLELKQKIQAHFGEESYFDEGGLNRAFLAEKVFSDPEQTKVINGLVHPAVKKDFEQWATSHQTPYVLKEAALLFESGSYQDLDKVINVSAPVELRMSRIMARDAHRSKEQVVSIMERQMSDSEKNKLADFVISNEENQALIPQVLQIHKILSKA
ncbi:dephospho-CoA kinase [Echinicola strongylocentroti]|uniref:Dephospho-CoA kinase n=1 Tax=Echinicola strongylocentroti TaxID=1795355 RepID=A0A2Z4IKP5_9BACT|nr:dephospho-CoA kinase [Echinicola strongylocentroti]AWW31289.1 dephospho-CoA kinase [Echinicola strongylocentroti]